MTLSYGIAAENTVALWLSSHQPVLVLRCRGKSTDAILDIGGPTATNPRDLDGHVLQLRFDEAKAVDQRWSEATSSSSVFSPNGRALIRQLVSADKLRVGWTPFNSAPVVATFDLRGLRPHAEELAKACGWTL